MSGGPNVDFGGIVGRLVSYKCAGNYIDKSLTYEDTNGRIIAASCAPDGSIWVFVVNLSTNKVTQTQLDGVTLLVPLAPLPPI